jgi:hypothetical protein
VTNKGLHIASGAGVIGVDVGDRWMVASQLVGHGGAKAVLGASVRLARAASGPLLEQEALLLGQTIAHAGFVGSRIVVCAPDAALLPAVLELPPRSSKAPIDQLARLEVARIHRREPEAFDLAMWDLPATDRTKGATHAMALALPTEAGDAVAAAFDVTGADIVAIEPRACALARAGTRVWARTHACISVCTCAWYMCVTVQEGLRMSACCRLYVAYCMLHIVCRILHAAYCIMLHIACCMHR